MLLITATAFGQRTYDCGNLNQRACGTGDWERVNMVAGENHKCETDLQESDGYCLNKDRNTLVVRNPFWTGWALENQMYGISANAPINFITWPAAHNAFSNETQGFSSPVYTNQRMSITDQLNAGVRHLELDPKYFMKFASTIINVGIPISDIAVRVCHASDVTLCLLPGWHNRLFGFVLTEIANWLDANPGQVVYVKLENQASLQGDIAKVYDEVARYLGNRVYRVPSGPITRWPTLQEIKNAGKSVIVVHHLNDSYNVPTDWVWNAAGLVQVSNHPNRQNFETCIADDGLTPISRGQYSPMSWWDTAEGRAESNVGGSATGLYWEPDVAAAARCGVAVIGMDFVFALDSNLALAHTTVPDQRLKRVVWSWRENDYGRAGPAVQEPADGRWTSNSSSSVLPVACAPIRPHGSTVQDRGWRVTSAEIPWNKQLGDAKCAAEFNTPTTFYEFALPENGFQNAQLQQAAGGRRVWLPYSVVATPNASLSSTDLGFRIDPGSSTPATQSLRITATPGTTIASKLTGNVPVNYSLPSNALSAGDYTFSLTLKPSVSSLAPGLYTGTLDLTLNAPYYPIPQTFSVNLRLLVKAIPTITVSLQTNTAPQGTPVTLQATVTGSGYPYGNVKFYRILDSQGQSTGQETVGVALLNFITHIASVPVSNLPLGTNTYVANFPGDASNTEVESDPFVLTITPRITGSPSSLRFTLKAGGTANVQTIALTGLGASPVANTLSCPWLKASIFQNTLTVGLLDAASTMALGNYSCTVRVQDALTAQSLGSTDFPVTLSIQTLLTSSLQRIDLSGNAGASQDFVVSTTSAAAFSARIDVAADQPWIIPEFIDTYQTPSNLRVSVDPQQLPVGISRGQVKVSSPNAPDLLIPVSFNKFLATTIDTVPSGRTIVVDGISYTAPVSFSWAGGPQHTLWAPTQAANGIRHSLRSWTLAGSTLSGNPVTFTAVNAGAALVANFDAAYQFATAVQPLAGGSITLTPSSPDGFYPAGALVSLQALPASNYTFTGWLGSLAGSVPSGSVTMNGPASVQANFSQVVPIAVTINSAVFGTSVAVDGVTYNLPASLLWIPGSTHQLAAVAQIDAAPGTRYRFLNWSNGGAISQAIVAPQSPLALTVAYQRQFLLTASVSPQPAGLVVGGGWYDQNTTAFLLAYANAGYTFSGFSGDLTGGAPLSVTMSAPRNLVANYAMTGNPVLSVVATGTRTDGPGPGQRTVPITIQNTGTALASNVAITGITGIKTMTGSGTVSVISVPAVGDLFPGGSSTANLVFDWPATATRVQFTINYAPANGAAGSTTLTMFR